MKISKYSNVRLLDVFLFGPTQILISNYVKNKILKYFIFITGVLNIIYNAHNYLYLDLGIIKKPVPFLSFCVNNSYGKTQMQRLFNIFIMYPVFMHIYSTTILPIWLSSIFLVEILAGFVYNLQNFINIWTLRRSEFAL